LRQDPDWILIWETRDKELLSMVIEASQTWHLTFSTYHTNNTVETLERLSKMYAWDNVENFWLARDSLLAILRWIVSVILVPKLCPFCKVKIEREEVIERIRKKWIEEEKITQLVDKNWEFYKRNLEWCGKCDNWFNWKQTINEIMNLSNHKIHYDVKHNNYSDIVTQFEKWMKYVNKWLIDVDTLAKNASK
jgi:type II secretory ATPase GspE/PulE/Tfp pilus assembly ATPase PilB-like protein